MQTDKQYLTFHQINQLQMERNEQRYEKYRIPPDFSLAQLHGDACKIYSDESDLYEKCPCCSNSKGNKVISLCSRLGKLKKISDQIPLFFMFLYLMLLFMILVVFVKVGEFILCNTCKPITYTLIVTESVKVELFLGYKSEDDLIFMIEIIILSLFIFMMKGFLKKKKYEYWGKHESLEKRSLQLTNLHKEATEDDIKQLFSNFHIEEVIFSYKVSEYFSCLKKIMKLKKQLRYLQKQEYANSSSIIEQKQKIQAFKISQLQSIVNHLNSRNNRLSIAFLVFQTIQQRNQALRKYKTFFIQKLFFKLCTSFSNCSIHDQHITVEAAPAAEDINWTNLQNPYLRTKLIRLSSFFVCFVLIGFSISSELIVFNNVSKGEKGDLVITGIILMMNFIIINFLEWTTKEIESYTTSTKLKISLIRKITFFMLFNVAVMPFFIFLYSKFDEETKIETSLEYLSLQVFLIGIGNAFKPFLTYFSIQRLIKWGKRIIQKKRRHQSELNQLEANELFEPLQFPLQIYYSLILTSLLMSFFYMSILQILFIIQIPAIILLYGIAKYMLLRVCKCPTGLSVQLNSFAQSLMNIFIPFSWLGRNLLFYSLIQSEKRENFLQYVFNRNIYATISAVLAFLFLFCGYPISFISNKLATRNLRVQIKEAFLPGEKRRTYQQANLYMKFYQQMPYKDKEKNKYNLEID